MANQITVNSGTGNITVTTSRAVIGTVANVASANYANFAGEVVDASQPNITSLGNLTGLNVTGTTTTLDLIVTGNLQIGNLVANSANYANFAGTANVANTVAGANVTGTVANATFATSAGIANTANTANTANSATVANSANSVTLANVSGAGNIASINLTGSTSNVLFGNGVFAPIPSVPLSGDGGNISNIQGANVSGAVGLATNATNANAVAGANVSGEVANANYASFANIANSANSVAVANVSGIGNIATVNLDGNASNVLFGNGTFGPEGSTGNANYANFAGTAFSVSGSNVSGTVANATYADNAGNANTANSATVAGSANSVAVGNVSGIGNIATVNLDGNASNILYGNGLFAAPAIISNVANANYANFAGTAFSVSGSNVSGEVANANFASYSNVANSANAVAGANVSGTVANATFALDAGNANVANTANSVAVANVSGIGNIATVNLDGNVSNLLTGNGTFVAIPTSVANANYANFAGTAYSVINPNIATVAGNIIDLQFYVNNVLDTNGHYYIDSDGYYFSFSDEQQDWGQNGGSNISGFVFEGDTTSGSNVITNATLYDIYQYDTYDLDSMSSFLVGQYFYTNQVGFVNDGIFPVLTKITAVDTANATITVDNNAVSSQSVGGFSAYTGVSLSDSTKNNYRVMNRPFMTTALSTSSTGNIITCANASIIADNFIDTPIVFSGNTGGIVPNQTYWVLTADGGTNEITISNTQGGAEVALTTDTGVMNINSQYLDLRPIALTTGFYFAGPYSALGLAYSGYTVDPDPNFSTDPTIVYTASTNSTDFNSDPDELSHYSRVDNGLVIGTDLTNTLTGALGDQFINNGLTIAHSGLSTQQFAGGFPRTDMRIINYTNNGSDTASLLSPLNPPSIGWSTLTGNVNTTVNDQYLRNGRIIGRLTWSGRSQTGQNAGSRPPASIQVQALGDWTGNTMPMGMYMQYTPTSAGGTNNVDRPRTWLGAANNTTRLSGATNVQIGPLKTDGNVAQQRALSGVSNQTWVDIGGYVQGNASSNAQGSLVNITTTTSGQDGNVALRLSRTVGNTANIEFVLPTATANTVVLKDNASGNTIATFTNNDVKVANLTVDTNGFAKLSSYTAAALTAITGQIGWMAAVSDSAGGSNPNGMIAFWDTTNNRWSYIHDNGAV